MHLGTPEGIALVSAPREPANVPALNLADCTHDEPVTLTIRIRDSKNPTQWKVGHRVLPNWREAIMAAHTVMGRLPGLRASLAQGYYSDFATGAYRPKQPWHSSASGDEILSLWPKRYQENYEARLRAGCGHPLPGDEHLVSSRKERRM